MAASEITSWVDAAIEQEEVLSMNLHQVNGNNVAVADNADGWGSAGEPEEDERAPTAAEQSIIQKLIRGLVIQSSLEKVAVLRSDPTSPFFSVTMFSELNLRPELLKGIFAMGYNQPSRIQEVALPFLMKDPPENLIAQSQSGTGKTAAFLLTLLSRVDASLNYPQALCLAPTYELAVQTGQVLQQMAQFCPEIKIVFAVRESGVTYGQQLTEHIIIGTPGTVIDWALRMKMFDLQKLKMLVLDEADVMIGIQGFHDISIKIYRKLSKDCQRMLFSATYDDEVMAFANTLIPDATTMRLEREQMTLDNIKQYYIDCPDQEAKYLAIANIYGAITVGGAVIFCQTKMTASWLSDKLGKDGHQVALLSGDLQIQDRVNVLHQFRDNKARIIITTNVMARGIDVEGVSLVVNFDLPVDGKFCPDCETYLHRVGRTGRFGKMGTAVNLVQNDRDRKILQCIEEFFGIKIPILDSHNIQELEMLEHA